jgi:hypothetical protein
LDIKHKVSPYNKNKNLVEKEEQVCTLYNGIAAAAVTGIALAFSPISTNSTRIMNTVS